jgi:hypothetical protein
MPNAKNAPALAIKPTTARRSAFALRDRRFRFGQAVPRVSVLRRGFINRPRPQECNMGRPLYSELSVQIFLVIAARHSSSPVLHISICRVLSSLPSPRPPSVPDIRSARRPTQGQAWVRMLLTGPVSRCYPRVARYRPTSQTVALATVITASGMETCSLRVVEGTTTTKKTTRLSLPAGSFLFGAYPRSARWMPHQDGADRRERILTAEPVPRKHGSGSNYGPALTIASSPPPLSSQRASRGAPSPWRWRRPA